MKCAFWLFLSACLAGGPIHGRAQDSVVLNYKGKVRSGGAPFSGQGHFMFALEDQAGEIFWSSGDFPYAGSTNNPANAVTVPVQQGLYTARLGDRHLGMPPLSLAALQRVPKPLLRIWFNDGPHGWQRAGEDVPLENLMASLTEASKRPITVAQADALLQELHAVHTLLERQQPAAPQAPPPPTFAKVKLTGPEKGRADAPLVLVEFTDYQCPYCKKFDDTVLPELVRKFVDTGKLRVVSRNLPLPFHQNAEPAARAAWCAGRQDKYWPMREALFGKSTELTETNIFRVAQAVPLDMAKFQSCFAGSAVEPIKQDQQEANSVGISGTPSFVLGKPQGDTLQGLVIVGAQPLATFEGEIQKLLAAK